MFFIRSRRKDQWRKPQEKFEYIRTEKLVTRKNSFVLSGPRIMIYQGRELKK